MNWVLPVPEDLTGLRTSVGLAKLLGLSYAKAGEILAQDGVAMGETALRKSDTLQSGETLEVAVSIHPKVHIPEVTPVSGLELLYGDTDLVAMDKPTGVTVRTGLNWDGPAVVEALRTVEVRISTPGPVECESIVRHLGAGISGAVMVARSELAYGKLKDASRYHRVGKIYLVVARDILKPSPGTIDTPAGWAPGHKFEIAMVVDGKSAVTHYNTAESLPDAASVRVQLETGHTYQIQVHLAMIGHPLLGGTGYGTDAKQAVRLGLERQ